MTKRFLALVVTIALVMVLFIPSSLAYFNMWVYTENGGALNARLTPSYGDNPARGPLPMAAAVAAPVPAAALPLRR